MDFGTQLNGFWKDFASHLGRFLVTAWLVVRMYGKLVGSAIGWLVAWLVGWLATCLVLVGVRCFAAAFVATAAGIVVRKRNSEIRILPVAVVGTAGAQTVIMSIVVVAKEHW